MKLLYLLSSVLLNKSNPSSNSDIDNISDPDVMLLRMLSECLHQRFKSSFGRSAVENIQHIAHKNGLNHEQKTYLRMFLTRIQSQQTFFLVLHVFL